jgi:hypothetical protein
MCLRVLILSGVLCGRAGEEGRGVKTKPFVLFIYPTLHLRETYVALALALIVLILPFHLMRGFLILVISGGFGETGIVPVIFAVMLFVFLGFGVLHIPTASYCRRHHPQVSVFHTPVYSPKKKGVGRVVSSYSMLVVELGCSLLACPLNPLAILSVSTQTVSDPFKGRILLAAIIFPAWQDGGGIAFLILACVQLRFWWTRLSLGGWTQVEKIKQG